MAANSKRYGLWWLLKSEGMAPIPWCQWKLRRIWLFVEVLVHLSFKRIRHLRFDGGFDALPSYPLLHDEVLGPEAAAQALCANIGTLPLPLQQDLLLLTRVSYREADIDLRDLLGLASSRDRHAMLREGRANSRKGIPLRLAQWGGLLAPQLQGEPLEAELEQHLYEIIPAPNEPLSVAYYPGAPGYYWFNTENGERMARCCYLLELLNQDWVVPAKVTIRTVDIATLARIESRYHTLLLKNTPDNSPVISMLQCWFKALARVGLIDRAYSATPIPTGPLSGWQLVAIPRAKPGAPLLRRLVDRGLRSWIERLQRFAMGYSLWSFLTLLECAAGRDALRQRAQWWQHEADGHEPLLRPGVGKNQAVERVLHGRG